MQGGFRGNKSTGIVALVKREQGKVFLEATRKACRAVSRLDAAIYVCSAAWGLIRYILSKSFLLKNIVMCNQLSHVNYWLYFICGDKIASY